MNLKIASLSVQHKAELKSEPLKSGNGSGKFSSALQKLMNPAQSKAFPGSNRPLQSGLSPNKKYAFYLESLRKGLMAKGKPLTKISLKKEDLLLLKEFLLHSGFSKEDAEKILKGLAKNHPGGEINLSQFFLKIAEFGPPQKEIIKPITLEPSAIPHIESALRYLGLTPREVDQALSAARDERGGLDLSKFVIRLKEITNRMMEKTRITMDQNSFHQISEKLERIGIQIPNKGMGDQISIKDFIRALEKLTGRMDKGNQLPANVKASIDQILERAVVASEKGDPISLSSSSLKPGPHHPSSEGKIGKEGGPVEKDGPHSNVRSVSDLDPAKGLKGENKDSDLAQRSKGENNKDLNPAKDLNRGAKDSGLGQGINRESRNLDTAQGLKGGAKDSDLGQGPKGGTKAGTHPLQSDTKTTDIPHSTASSTFSEAINTIKQGQKMATNNLLPHHVINQVGKQIARSIHRGEGVIRFQLKPPDLGFMRVEMDIKDNVLRLGLITENSSVKEMLLSHVHELKEALVQQGVKLEKVDIQINYNFDQSLANSKEELEEKQRSRREFNGTPFTGEGDTEDPEAVTRMMATNDHLLDLVA